MHFDWTINVSSLASAVALLAAVINYGSKGVRYLYSITLRVNIMWAQFVTDHPEKANAFEPASRQWARPEHPDRRKH